MKLFAKWTSFAFALLFVLTASVQANNYEDFRLGQENFRQVTKYIDERYENVVDFAELYESAWKSLAPILPVTSERLLAAAPVQASSRELHSHYAQKIEEALALSSRNHPEEATPTVSDLWNRSINGLVFGLHDQYSQYLPPIEKQELDRALSGAHDESRQFFGVGIHVEWDTENDLGILVVTPVKGSPAYKSGIQPQDVIIGVDGKPLTELEGTFADKLQTAVDLIKGEKDTEVTLTVKRGGSPEPIEYTLVRAPINPDFHFMQEMLDTENGIGYIYLESFYADCSKDVRDALRYLKTQGMEKVIFDLRSNPGGYLDQAVKIAELFLDKGDLITYTYGRSSPYKEYRRRESNIDGFSDIPMAILLNEASASASEVVTGALSDNHRAVVVGKKSFGKGSVQELFNLKAGAGLRLTTAKYYTPSGKCIHELGIEPDLEVERITMEEYEELRDKDYSHVSRMERKFEIDPQLRAAHEYLIGKRTLADLGPGVEEG